MSKSRFSGKCCIVTGAASGIGKAVVTRFAREGASVLIVDLNPEHGNKAVEEIRATGAQAQFAQCDVSNSQQVQAAIKQAVDAFGKIDVLVNNAAMMTFQNVVDLDESAWDKVMAVNIKSVFLF